MCVMGKPFTRLPVVATIIARSPKTPASSSRPAVLAQHYLHRGVGGLYVADLDAICGGPLQVAVLRELESLAVPIWIDAGVRSLVDWQRKVDLLPGEHWRWILATETFRRRPQAAGMGERQVSGELQHRLAAGRVTIGIDLQGGRLRLPHNRTSSAPILSCVADWARWGARSFCRWKSPRWAASGVATLELCRRNPPRFS